MIRNTFPRCAACILTMRAGWKSPRADARARLLALSPCTLTLVHFHVGIDHLSSTEPRRSGEIPIFYPRSGLRCQLDGFVPVWDLYEFRLPTIFTRTVVRARHRVIMMLLHVAYMHSNTRRHAWRSTRYELSCWGDGHACMHSRRCNHFYSTPLTNPKRPVPELGSAFRVDAVLHPWGTSCQLPPFRQFSGNIWLLRTTRGLTEVWYRGCSCR